MPDTSPLGPPIETEEQAQNWLAELVADIEQARRLCDLSAMVVDAQVAYQRWMMYYGRGLGVLVALHRCGKLSDEGYRLFQQRLLATTVPTVVNLDSELIVSKR